MKKALLVAEKPDLLRKILSAYKNHKNEYPYVIEQGIAQVGHLFGLKLPKEMDEDLKNWKLENYPWFPERYEMKITDPGKRKIYYKIEDAIKSGQFDFVIHAGDPDQEGEALIRETLEHAGNQLPVYRLWTNASTEDEYAKALKELKSDSDPFFENLYAAAIARRNSDYNVGMNLSPVLSLLCNDTYHVGRIKAFIDGIIVTRERELLNWKPSSIYQLGAVYQEGFAGSYTAEQFDTEQDALDFAKNLKKEANIIDVKVEKTKKYAPHLFKLSTLQIFADAKGVSASQVQDICQSLYQKGYSTYPRTSCEFVDSQANFKAMLKSAFVFEDLRPFVARIKPEDIERIKKNKNYVNNEKTAESGHQALTPTTVVPDLSNLTDDEKTVLHMIFAQYVAIFLPPMIQEKTKIITENNGYEFVTNGKRLLDKGFTELLTVKLTDVLLPVVKKGDIVHVDQFVPIEKKATPPKRYTQGTLIQALENPAKYLQDNSLKSLSRVIDISIGRPSTREPIINQLITMKYISIKNKSLVPTQKAMDYFDNLHESAILRADTTSIWERDLEEIRKGNMQRSDFEKNINEFIVTEIERLKKCPMIKAAPKNTGLEELGICPNCGKKILNGKFGAFCENKCGFTIGKYRGKTLTKTQIKKLLNKKPIVVKGLTSKKGSEYNMQIELIGAEKNNYNGKTYFFPKFKEEFSK